MESSETVETSTLIQNDKGLQYQLIPNVDSNGMSKDQRDAFNAVFDFVSLGRPMNIFITGSGGTGKSYLLQEIVKKLKSLKKRVAVTASTGIAATSIKGCTIHSFAGIGKQSGNTETLVKNIKKNSKKYSNWMNTDVLIIDEVSMIPASLFTILDIIARSLRTRSKRPFGGMQLILFGDFLQLPPVRRTNNINQNEAIFPFETTAWKEGIDRTFELKQIFRQKDYEFVSLLQRIRINQATAEDMQLLKSRIGATLKLTERIEPTRLYSVNDSVNRVNNARLLELPGDEYTFAAIKKIYGVKTGYADTILKSLSERVPVEDEVCLKEGAQVMLMKNLDVDHGLANGSRGVVVGFTDATKAENKYPLVKFNNGITKAIIRETWEIGDEYTGWKATFTQIPLRLAWACTIHKAQGATLDAIEIDLNDIFEDGQAYVALSRAKSLEGLRILKMNDKCIKVNKKALDYYQSISPQKRTCESLQDDQLQKKLKTE